MADPKNAATTKAPAAAASPTPANAEPKADKPAKEPKVPQREVFASEKEAVDEAANRTKGPRRAFKCEHAGKTYFVVANNEGRAGGVAFGQLGGKVDEIGKVAKTKAVTVDALLNALNSLSEEERKKVQDAMAALKK